MPYLCDVRMDEKTRLLELESSVEELHGWVESLSRRVEELEHSSFQLLDEEEVVLVTMPRGRSLDL